VEGEERNMPCSSVSTLYLQCTNAYLIRVPRTMPPMVGFSPDVTLKRPPVTAGRHCMSMKGI